MNMIKDREIFAHRRDIQQGHLWDSIKISKDHKLPNKIAFFQDPISAHRSLVDTNMYQGGRLPPPEEFVIQRVLFTFSSKADDRDIYRFAETRVFRFMLQNKIYLQSPIISLQMRGRGEIVKAPIRICEYCCGVWVNGERCPGCGAMEFKISTIGGEEAGRCFVMDLGKGQEIKIEMGMYFRVELEGDMEGYVMEEDIKIWCHFEGLHTRGVQ